VKTIHFNSSGSRSNSSTSNGWTCNSYGNGSSGVCVKNNTNTGFVYSCSGNGANQGKIWNKCEINTPYVGSKNVLGTIDLSVPKSFKPSLGSINTSSESFLPKLWIPDMLSSNVYSVRFEGRIDKSLHQVLVGNVLSEADKYGLNTPQYQSQVNKMSADDLSKQYQNWKVLEKQIMVGKVLSEADKYGLNNSVYQQQVNTMSDYELSKQYQEWRALEKRILVGKVLTQYCEATGKSIDEIDETTKSVLNNADQASLEKIYSDNIKNKQVVLVGTILSQINEISGKPFNELDQETIDFVNNSELATLQLIYNTNVNQKQLLAKESTSLYELYFRLPVNVSYNILYNPGYFNSDINKLLTRQLDLNNISNLNLSNNQIGDDGVKLLADSLAKGEMPKLKVLHLHGNKITDEGQGFLIDSLKAISQHIVIKFKKYSTDLGQKTIKPALKEFIKYAQEKGIDTTHISTDKPTLEYLKDVGIIGKNIVFGVAKCNYTLLEILTLDTTLPSVVTDIAIENSGSKVLKKGNVQVCIGLEVYDAFVSTEGVDLAIKAVELIGEE
jgi:hypothetical protein